jgi:hypothetical protein
LPATTLEGGVPDKVIAGAEATPADPGADEAALLPVAALSSEPPHPDSRRGMPKESAKPNRRAKFLTVIISELQYGRLPSRKCRQ